MSNINSNNINQNILLLGTKKSGKTAYIKRLETGEFQSEYNPTGAYTTKLHFPSTKGIIIARVTEIGSDLNSDSKSDLYNQLLVESDGFLVFFDLSKEGDCDNALEIVKEIKRYFFYSERKCPPIVLCGNKNDLDIPIRNHLAVQLSGDYQYVSMAVKSNYNHIKPFHGIFIKTIDKRINML